MTIKEKYLQLLEAHQDAVAKFNKAQIRMGLESDFFDKKRIDDVQKAFQEVQDAFKKNMDYVKRWVASGKGPDDDYKSEYFQGDE